MGGLLLKEDLLKHSRKIRRKDKGVSGNNTNPSFQIIEGDSSKMLAKGLTFRASSKWILEQTKAYLLRTSLALTNVR